MGTTACYLASKIWGVGPVSNDSKNTNGKAFIDQILTALLRQNCEGYNAGQYLTFKLGPFHTLSCPGQSVDQCTKMQILHQSGTIHSNAG